MLLLVDAGNSSLKWALTSGDRFVERGSWRHDECTATEGVAQIGRVAGVRSVQRIVFSAVVGSARLEELQQALLQQFAVTAELQRPAKLACGLRNAYQDPAQLGMDRWAALLAAWHRAQGPVLVVDCGTAVTVDAVDREGAMVGGAIFPGLALLRSSLLQGTAEVRPRGDGAPQLETRSSADAVALGVYQGWQGAIAQLVALFRQRLGQETPVFLTGGDAARLHGLPGPLECYPELVLEGLNLLAQESAPLTSVTGS